MWLWRLTSPAICCLQGGHPGKLVVQGQSKSKGWRSRRADSVGPSPRVGEDPCPSYKAVRWREQIFPSSTFLLDLRCLEETYPRWGGPSALLKSPIQMLIPFGNTLQTHLEIMCDPISGHPVTRSSWPIKLTITSSIPLPCLAFFAASMTV